MSIDGGVPSDQAIGTHDAGFDSLAGLLTASKEIMPLSGK
jgi:hypothetical protein